MSSPNGRSLRTCWLLNGLRTLALAALALTVGVREAMHTIATTKHTVTVVLILSGNKLSLKKRIQVHLKYVYICMG